LIRRPVSRKKFLLKYNALNETASRQQPIYHSFPEKYIKNIFVHDFAPFAVTSLNGRRALKTLLIERIFWKHRILREKNFSVSHLHSYKKLSGEEAVKI